MQIYDASCSIYADQTHKRTYLENQEIYFTFASFLSNVFMVSWFDFWEYDFNIETFLDFWALLKAI